MKRHTPLLLAVLGACCWGLAAAQFEIIQSDNGLPWRGETGPDDFCDGAMAENTTVSTYAMEFKYETPGHIDNVAGSAVKLFCRDATGTLTDYVVSFEGRYGEWRGVRSCLPDQSLTGFRLRVLPEQGTFGDDFGVDNIQMHCSDGTILDGLEAFNFNSLDHDSEETESKEDVSREWVEVHGRQVEEVRSVSKINGNWGSWVYCSPGLQVVGIRTVVEEGHISDDAGLTDVTLFCG